MREVLELETVILVAVVVLADSCTVQVLEADELSVVGLQFKEVRDGAGGGGSGVDTVPEPPMITIGVPVAEDPTTEVT